MSAQARIETRFAVASAGSQVENVSQEKSIFPTLKSVEKLFIRPPFIEEKKTLIYTLLAAIKEELLECTYQNSDYSDHYRQALTINKDNEAVLFSKNIKKKILRGSKSSRLKAKLETIILGLESINRLSNDSRFMNERIDSLAVEAALVFPEFQQFVNSIEHYRVKVTLLKNRAQEEFFVAIWRSVLEKRVSEIFSKAHLSSNLEINSPFIGRQLIRKIEANKLIISVQQFPNRYQHTESRSKALKEGFFVDPGKRNTDLPLVYEKHDFDFSKQPACFDLEISVNNGQVRFVLKIKNFHSNQQEVISNNINEFHLGIIDWMLRLAC